MRTDRLVKLTHANPKMESTLVVNWCLTNICNYTCSYCPKILHDHSVGFPELETVKAFCARLFKQKGGGQNTYFEFTGGEVTLWQDFLPLLEYLKAQGANTTFLSNGSRPMAFWKKVK